jgi:hypothetical protein
MTYFGRRFSLSDVPGTGVSCDRNGLFVGGVPLLERCCGEGPETSGQWQPRQLSDLNYDLSKRYGVLVELNRNIAGLQAVARALGRGDLLHAQIAALHLEIPDPPPMAKSQTAGEIVDLARQLHASGLLKADWDPTKHPRWPAGSSSGIGGEFAPAENAVADSTTAGAGAPVIPAQITIPAPLELPDIIPFPSEIVPPPIAIPDTYPRELRNPYPDRPDCKKEWENAIRKCNELANSGRFRRDDYRGMGEFFYQCVMGYVSADCGGNPTGT